MNDGKKSSRRRRSSSLLYQEPPESMEHMSDQSALPNLNANWVNAKGTLATKSRKMRTNMGPFQKKIEHAAWNLLPRPLRIVFE